MSPIWGLVHPKRWSSVSCEGSSASTGGAHFKQHVLPAVG